MKISSMMGTFVAAAVLSIAFAGVGRAQSASSDFSKAGTQSESAGSSIGHAVKNAAEGTATAAEDTATTGKVKVALHNNKTTEDKDIHVTTVDGVVTLRGAVNSEEVAREATRVTEETSGVKAVHNDLHVASARAE